MLLMDDFLYQGGLKEETPHGKGVKVSLLLNQESNYLYQEGVFSEGVLQEGETLYADLVTQEGYDPERKCASRKINGLQFKQVQTQKLARMNT